MKRHGIILPILLTSVSFLSGCLGTSCTLVGCNDSYTLFIEAPGAVLTAGNYSVNVTFDAEIVDNCTVLISDDVTECGSKSCILQNTCQTVDASDVHLKELQITTMNWEGPLPQTVSLSLGRDGEGLAERTFVPDYVEFYPNGEGCDETPCLNAINRLVLSN